MSRRALAWLAAAALTAGLPAVASAGPAVTGPPDVDAARAIATAFEKAAAEEAARDAGAGEIGEAVAPEPGQRTVVLAPDGSVVELGDEPRVPDPAFLEQVPGLPCTAESEYEADYAVAAERYGDACKRIQFAFGPIQVRPGQNTAVLQPVTIEQPRYDGMIVRFKPDLERTSDGSKPNTEDLHLHHATWLNLGDAYGDGPFFAAGEEKTIAGFPDGYGMAVQATDEWGLLYMVHNALATPDSVWLTYDIDFVGREDAERLGLAPVKPLWLDVQKRRIHEDAPSTSSNPVFNVQRGFGHVDAETGERVCRWPDENCARFDTYGNVTPQQGVTESDGGFSIAGQDYVVPAHMAGTIVGLGGHLHPGGIRTEVSVVRDGVEKLVNVSDALYWDYDDPTRIGSEPTSWNFSMTVTGAPLDWKVKIREGDVVRLNAVYDSEIASWYENMGIVVALVATDDPFEPAGVDVFTDDVVLDPGVASTGLTPPGAFHYRGFRPAGCTPDLTGVSGQKRLCLRGQVTHGAKPESGNAGGPCTEGTCPALPEEDGPEVTDIHSVGFTYGQADLGVIGTTGVPLVKKGSPVRLWSEDSAANVWHTYTRCKEPCSGPTRINYPLADGGKGADDLMDFDSAEIGYGLLFEPAKSQVGGSESYDQEWVEDGLFWDFTPSETGTYSFYCRIHPGMRGAFRVVE